MVNIIYNTVNKWIKSLEKINTDKVMSKVNLNNLSDFRNVSVKLQQKVNYLNKVDS